MSEDIHEGPVRLLSKPWAVRGFLRGLRYPGLVIAVAVRTRHGDQGWLRRVDDLLAGALPGSAPTTGHAGAPSEAGAAVAALLFWVREIQLAAKLPVLDLGRIISVGPVRTELVIPTFLRAFAPTHAAVEWLLHLFALAAAGQDTSAHIQDLATHIDELQRRLQTSANVPRLLRVAHGLGLPFTEIAGGVFQVGYAARSRWLESTFTDRTAKIAARFAHNKTLAASVLRQSGVPVPLHVLVHDGPTAAQAAQALGYPVVVKPADTDGGTAVATGLLTPEEVEAAFAQAARHSSEILVEKHFEGRDYRMTVVGSELIWAAERIPGGITGDGTSTVSDLVEEQAEDRARRDAVGGRRHALVLDEEALGMLAKAGLDAASVPAAGRFVRLRRAANVARGGRAVGVFDRVHPDNRKLAIRAARALRLDVAGIDLLMPDISRSWLEVGAAICEVNAQPDLGIYFPHVYADVLGRLVSGNGRIPIVVVFGAPADSTLLGEIARSLAAGGRVVGQVGPTGVVVGEKLVHAPAGCHDGARMLMTDTTVEAAVIAVDEAVVLLTGLPFDRFDVLVVAGDEIRAPRPTAGLRADPTDELLRAVLPMCTGPVLTLDEATRRRILRIKDGSAEMVPKPVPGSEIAARVAAIVSNGEEAARSAG